MSSRESARLEVSARVPTTHSIGNKPRVKFSTKQMYIRIPVATLAYFHQVQSSLSIVWNHPMKFDTSLTDEEVGTLRSRANLFRSAFFDRDLRWWAEVDASNDRVLCVADDQNPTTCIGRFYLQQLRDIQDEDEFCLQIITGAISTQ